MSAPLGRIVDRHIKLIRYRNHPVVLANEKLSEPLHLVVSDDGAKSKQATQRRNRSRKNGPKSRLNQQTVNHRNQRRNRLLKTMTPAECMSDDVQRMGLEICAATCAITNGCKQWLT